MSTTDDYLQRLYDDAVRTRDEWFATVVASINRLSQTMGSSQQFIADLGHLVPPPPVPDAAPLASEPPQAAPATPPPLPWEVEEAMRGGPPPLPTGARPIQPPGTYDDVQAGVAFEQGRSMHGGRR